MECKVSKMVRSYRSAGSIGIYPEWNVKINVSYELADDLEYWNISRMECKVAI